MATLVGFITLFGIAVRNGILLVSRYQDLHDAGVSWTDAVVNGSMERLGPILMTALTAGLALIPLALGLGEPGQGDSGALGRCGSGWSANLHDAQYGGGSRPLPAPRPPRSPTAASVTERS